METGTYKHSQTAKPKRGIIGRGAGKGDNLRKGADLDKYREGWEKIWGNKVKIVDNDPEIGQGACWE